jgi:hypothetical protein
VIVAMLRTPPQRRRKSTAHSSISGQPPRTESLQTQQHRRYARTSTDPIGEAYGRFLELPVPVVLAALWLFGALLLGLLVGALVMVGYSGEVLLLRAIALA